MSDDYISRQAVIECFTWTNDKADIWNRIKQLPSVNPQEPKTGHWILSDDGLCRPICDKCGAHPWKGYIPSVEEATEVFKYCPNCGAKMSEIPTGCSNSDSCENCKYSDGDCCRLIYEAKMVEPQERNE